MAYFRSRRRDGDAIETLLLPSTLPFGRPVARSRIPEASRSVRHQRQPAPGTSRERYVIALRPVDLSCRRILFEGVNPRGSKSWVTGVWPIRHGVPELGSLQLANIAGKMSGPAQIKPLRGPSSAARIRVTCCAVNMNIAESST